VWWCIARNTRKEKRKSVAVTGRVLREMQTYRLLVSGEEKAGCVVTFQFRGARRGFVVHAACWPGGVDPLALVTLQF
jgi:hypothetical protein